MELEFSSHALKQLEVRKKITKAMVIVTVKNPDKKLVSYRGRQLYQKRFGDYILEVVSKVEDNKIVIITQYILE